ncbi:MAG: type III-B CRISPR module-associated protein Cmr5 [Bacteroidia bacterium]
MSERATTLMQRRAEAAWKAVKEVKGKPLDYQRKCAALARRVPALIRASGLGQTLAFLNMKIKPQGGDEHEWLLRHLSRWVLSQLGFVGSDSRSDLLDWIVNKADQRGYRYATQEALAYLQWVKRFAESELREEEKK